MFPNLRAKPNLAKVLDNPSLVVEPRPKFSVDNWEFSNNMKLHLMKEQERLKDRLINQTEGTIDEVTEITENWQSRVKHLEEQRAAEISFLAEELEKQRKNGSLELEALSTYLFRIRRAIESLNLTLQRCQQCIVLREGRLGVENCVDEVERELRRELKTVQGSQAMMYKTEKEVQDQIRSLRAAIFLIDLNLEGKAKALSIDEKNSKLKETYSFIGQEANFSNFASIDHCPYSLEEWYTEGHRMSNDKALTSAGSLRLYTDIMLKQIYEDVSYQLDRTNQAFLRRINGVKAFKSVLELRYQKTAASIGDVTETIKALEDNMRDKERAVQLCKARLSNRLQRPGVELTCDYVQEALYMEFNDLQATMCKLQQKLTENKALLRYLLHTQVVQSEEINLKTNSIKIDECDCMALRSSLSYTRF